MQYFYLNYLNVMRLYILCNKVYKPLFPIEHMKNLVRLRNNEVEFLNNYGNTIHDALNVIKEKLIGPKIDDPKYWELKSEIKKLNEKLDKLQDFVDQRSGY